MLYFTAWQWSTIAGLILGPIAVCLLFYCQRSWREFGCLKALWAKRLKTIKPENISEQLQELGLLNRYGRPELKELLRTWLGIRPMVDHARLAVFITTLSNQRPDWNQSLANQIITRWPNGDLPEALEEALEEYCPNIMERIEDKYVQNGIRDWD